MAIYPLSPAGPAPDPVALDAPTTPTRAPRLPAGGVTTNGVTLTIPIDSETSEAKVRRTAAATSINRRDSLKRREALLRGKEGTRRRQRWENDRLLSNPHAVPPSAADWEPRPLHPQRHVPYECASLWDNPAFQKRHRSNQPKQQDTGNKVPKELKARLKRSHGAVGLLKALEEEVRKFLGTQNEQDTPKEAVVERPESPVHVNIEDVEDESDEEIVFVSKKMRYKMKRRGSEKLTSSMVSFVDVRVTEKVLFESLLSDPGASFGRWLVHSIATYYGLKSWSVTTGNPAKRVAYVGLKESLPASASSVLAKGMPKPLYLML